MPTPLFDALRFGRGWLRPPSYLQTRERFIEPEEGGPPVPATLLAPERPSARGEPLVGWVVLHGLTRPGRRHPSLLRFARAVASAGGRVLIPEIPEWTEMWFAPERAQAVIRGAVAHMAMDAASAPGGVMLVGFSFGAPQALLVAADPAFRPLLRGVVGWGGYGDLHRTVLFQFTGEHEWKGRRFRTRPDPYGRWIVGANCLPLAQGEPGAEEVAEALRELAVEAGERAVMAWDPSLEPVRRHLRRRLPRRGRPLYDLFAPPGDQAPDPVRTRELTDRLIPEVRREIPLLDPLPLIEGIPVPVRLLHGRGDHLIPFTETLAVAEALAHRAPDLEHGVTGLFAHSGGGGRGGPVARLAQAAGFLRSLSRIFQVARTP